MGRAPDFFYHYRDWDEAAMMSQAWAMTQGQVLYRDIYQIHPLLNFAVFYPFFLTLPVHVVPHAVKVFNALVVLACALVIRKIVLRWLADECAAVVAAALFAFLCSANFWWSQSSYGEFYMILPLLLAVSLLQEGSRSSSRLFAIGLLFGIAIFLKQVALVDTGALMLGFLLLARYREEGAGRVVGWVAGGLCTVGASVGAYLWWHGTLALGTRLVFLEPLQHYVVGKGRAAIAQEILGALWGDLPVPLVSLGVGMLVAIALLLRADRATRALRQLSMYGILTLWLVVDVLVLSAAGRFYEHYILQLTAALAMLAVFWIAWLPHRLRTVAVTLCLVAIGLSIARASLVQLAALRQEGWCPQAVKRSSSLASFVRRTTTPKDRIFLYGTWGLDVFYLAERLSSNGIYMSWDMVAQHTGNRELEEKKQRELLTNLPRLVLCGRVARLADGFFMPFLKTKYRRVGEIEGVEIFMLRAEDAGA